MEQFDGVGITEFHEMWHAKQADNFKGKEWIFTDDNRNEYIQQLRKDCKPKVDNLGITGNNLRGISNCHPLHMHQETGMKWKLNTRLIIEKDSALCLECRKGLFI